MNGKLTKAVVALSLLYFYPSVGEGSHTATCSKT
jgi:hypothetical protein